MRNYFKKKGVVKMVNEIKEKETREDVEIVVDEVTQKIINFVGINKDKIFSKRMGDYEGTMWHILLRGLKFMKKNKDNKYSNSIYPYYESWYRQRIKKELQKNEVFEKTEWFDLLGMYLHIRDILTVSIGNLIEKYDAIDTIKEEKILWSFLFSLYSLFLFFNPDAKGFKMERKYYREIYKKRFLNL